MLKRSTVLMVVMVLASWAWGQTTGSKPETAAERQAIVDEILRTRTVEEMQQETKAFSASPEGKAARAEREAESDRNDILVTLGIAGASVIGFIIFAKVKAAFNQLVPGLPAQPETPSVDIKATSKTVTRNFVRESLKRR